MRSCGECTECCQGWLTDESLNLKPGSPCVNCTSEGCGIYETRPEKPCRTFKCGWLTHAEDFPDHMRPDKCGAIILLDRDWYSWKVVRAVPTGEVVPADTHQYLLDYAKARQLPFSFIERTIIDGQYRERGEKAMGPPKFTAELKYRNEHDPVASDIFYTL